MQHTDFLCMHVAIILVMVSTACILNLVSSFSDDVITHLPRLRAEMEMHKFEEQLRFEKKLKFSPKMLSHITEKLVNFCIAVCPGVNMDLARRFSKKFTYVAEEYEILNEKQDKLYVGFEKAFSNCLLIRYLNALGYGASMTMPQINVFNIKQTNEFIQLKGLNLTIFPLANYSKEEYQSTKRARRSAKTEEDTTDGDYLLGPVTQYSAKELNNMENYFEETLFSSEDFEYSKSEIPFFDENSVNIENKIIDRIMRLFKLSVGLFHEQCPKFYKPYANFWENFINSIQIFFRENEANKLLFLMYLHFNGFMDELQKCTTKPDTDLFPNYVEMGKTFAI